MMKSRILNVFAICCFLTSCGELSPRGHISSKPSDDPANHEAGDDRRNSEDPQDQVNHAKKGTPDSRNDSKSHSGRASRILTPSTQTIVVGKTFMLQLQRSRMGADDQYVFSSTSLPTGLTVDKDSGLISGLVIAPPGDYTVVISFREANETASHQDRTVTFTVIVTR